MFGKLTFEEAQDLLRQELIGRIGCHANNITYVVPISYAYDGLYVYCHTYEGMKMSIMRKNPEVCFQVDRMKNTANWESVIAWGIFEELKDPAARREALEYLVKRNLPLLSSDTMHLSPQWPFAANELNDIDGVVFRIRLDEVHGRYERQSTTARITG